ncbi:N-acetylmuramoyl-L-alanine amidase CwlD [Saliterribacillus persicus]|uniref:N-acetylmuramoyl-L-alanine amidase n=1 Tax=Saliterribacillus persicus TaxID=930114 RepID=A0A368X6B7_9BACI|nr:N-acetylmuramoyl-L-alanine amidase CwlD [Saliterribacillus persicus]RCW63530.1 N-acetylmuramoyl-L-alanine amidase [Saliterribacillus persicus]
MLKKWTFLLWTIGLIALFMLILYPITQLDEEVDQFSLPLSGKVIVLDPGHGGVDGGAEGSDDTQEKGIALEVTFLLRDYLQQAGAMVYLTRETDVDLASDDTTGLSRRKSEDIRNRVSFIQSKDPDFFLSIHLNALPDRRWKGAQTFYYPALDKSKQLATSIQDEIKRNMENTTREALALNAIYLLKYTELPGALIEIGFLSNHEERENLKSKSYQRQMAISIYEGILNYTVAD